jgi:hypothetical protein
MMRRLPGSRRGFIEQSSLWEEDDHLLAVTAHRFRERYRRFYYREVQAIVVTRCARYSLSTRAAALGFVLLMGCIFPVTRVASAVALGLCVIAWAVVSSRFSCVCRLHTAVSAETLNSVYRIWTARKLLARLEPLIQAAQASLPPPPEGPEPVVPPGATAPPLPSMPPPPPAEPAVAGVSLLAAPPAPVPPAPRRTAPALLLLLLVLVDAATTYYDAPLKARHLNVVVGVTLLVAQLAALIWIIVQFRARAVARSILLWAIAFVLYVGAMMYAQVMATSFEQIRAGRQGPVLAQRGDGSEALYQVYAGGCVVFAIVGALLLFRPATEDER